MIQNAVPYIALYSLQFLACGTFNGILGPIIPYLAEEKHVNQTQYSFVFAIRTFGSAISIILYKILEKHQKLPQYHIILCFSCFIAFLGYITLPIWNNFFTQGLSIIIVSFGFSFTLTVVSVCMIIVSKQKSGQIIPFVHSMFGMGVLIGPLILRKFQLDTSVILGFIYLLAVIISYVLPSPKYLETKNINNQANFGKVSTKIQIMLCIGIFFWAGCQSTYIGWIATYAVLYLKQQKKQAVIYVTFFGIACVVFRLITAYSTLPTSTKLKYFTTCLLITGTLSILSNILGYHQFLCYFSAMFFGAGTSSILALFMAICSEYKLKLRPDQSYNLAASASLSSGFIASLTGYIMKADVNRLFIILFIITSCLFLVSDKLIKQLKLQTQNQQSVQLKQHLKQNQF